MENPIPTNPPIVKVVKLHKTIREALSAKLQANPNSPTNLFDMNLSELRGLGYKNLKPTDEIQNGDILKVGGKKDVNSLFCVLENAKDYRKKICASVVGKLEVLRK